ncbi:MAG: hypothetical protein FWB71_04630 [Defluviitaleaceae bacterium]|nr:hypothetical protein [Defluviitaleaceae bacterium]
MKFVKSGVFAALILVVLHFVGCGREEARGERDLAFYLANPGELHGVKISIAHLAAGFDFSGLYGFVHAFNHHDDNPGITVTTRLFLNEAAMRDAIAMEIMGGINEDTLISANAFDWRGQAAQNYFVDWFDILNADPYFNEDNWFMNVFRALSVNSRLTIFPLGFKFEAAVYRQEIPDLHEAFASRETVTTNNLMHIIENFETPTGGTRILGMNSYYAVLFNLYQFLDEHAGRVEFNTPEFIELITRANSSRSSAPAGPFVSWARDMFMPPDSVAHATEDLVLRWLTPRSIQPLIIQNNEWNGLKGSSFITNNTGQLLIYTSRPAFALSAGATYAQQAAAWKFTQFFHDIANSTLQTAPMHGVMAFVPVYRPHLATMIPYALEDNQMRTLRFGLPFEWWDAANREIIYNIYTRAGKMPMTHVRPASEPIINILYNILMDFHNGFITAQQAADYLQNRITLVIMERE